MRISQDTVLFHPETGDVEPFYESPETNPAPSGAVARRRSTQSKQNTPQVASLKSGIPPISWAEVKSYSNKDVADFKRQYEVQSLLEGNTKTSKERPTGREGKIKGLSLAPHFYPNLLEVLERDGKIKQFKKKSDKDVFNSFDGASSTTALRWLRDHDVPRDSFVNLDDRTAQDSMLDFCVGSSPACRMTCLVYAGQNPATNEAPRAKMKHTLAFLSEPALFVATLWRQMRDMARAANKKNYDFVVRLNMLSDIPWYVICPDLIERAVDEEGVAFYDYTKVPFWNDPAYQRVADKLDLTFSYSGANTALCMEALQHGVRIAAAFAPADPNRPASVAHRTSWPELLLALRTGGLEGRAPRRGVPHINLFGGDWPLVDGDESDYRMDDPAPSIVALNFKAPNLTEARIPGITARMAQGRKQFAVPVPDPTGGGAAYALARSSAKKRWKGVDADGLDAEDAVRLREQFTAEGAQPVRRPKWLPITNPLAQVDDEEIEPGEEAFAPMPMQELVEGVDVIALIGPHVPTVLND
jgi:hypothetical protein